MIGMKDQCFGVEVEMTGLTRGQAAQALANYFGTEPYYVGGGYDKWSVKDPDGKVWSIMSDSSIVTEMKTESGYTRTSDIEYRVEMVTPKLTYAELPRLQECVRQVRHAGAKVNNSCGIQNYISIRKSDMYLHHTSRAQAMPLTDMQEVPAKSVYVLQQAVRVRQIL